MSNSSIYYDDKAIGNVYSMSTEEVGFPKENAVDNILSSEARSTVITQTDIVFDLGSAVELDAVKVKSNIESGDTTFELRYGTTSACSTGSVSLTKESDTLKDLSIGTAYQYYMIRAVKASGSYISFFQVCLYKTKYQFDKNPVWGYVEGWKTKFTGISGDYFQKIRDYVARVKIFSMNFKQITDTQKEILQNTIGLENFVTFYNGIDNNFYFGFVTIGDAIHIFTDNWELPVSFEGVN